MSDKLWATPRSYSFANSHQPGLTTLDCQVRGLYPEQERYHGVSTDLNQLTLFAEAFPVSRIRSLADVPAPTTSATSGQNSPASFASVDPDGSWRKTCQGYSQVTLDGSLERFSETWPRAGMTRSGTAYLRQPSAPLTKGTESGSLPTPTAEAYGTSNNGSNAGRPSTGKPSLNRMAARALWPTPISYNERGSRASWVAAGKGSMDLVTAVKLWPTPTAGDAKSAGSRNLPGSNAHHGVSLTDAVTTGNSTTARRWPTPSARDWKDTPGMVTTATNPDGSTRQRTDQLARAVYSTPTVRDAGTLANVTRGAGSSAKGNELIQPLPVQVGGTLNPTWVEWLMGYPLEWTACAGWGTRSSRKSRNGSRGKS